jgi:RNA polymerase sigma factor (sigma-70 family)
MASGQLGNLMRFVRRLVHAPVGAERTDRQLLEQFAEQRDQAAFSELVARHGPMVFNVCRRVLDDVHAAEDAFQAAFLVLARKAASLHWHESVGNWLYETSFRTATKAKGDAARRRAREQQSAAVPRSEPMPELDWRELRAVLDQELSRLPSKYRSPLVLCYLEGKSNEEAARLLGWPVGTVSGRLARARDLLRDRLSRRGLALTVSSLSVALSRNALEAAVPPSLAASAVQSAVQFTASSATAGAIAAPITLLAEGVLQAMFLHKLKLAAGMVLLLGVFGTGLGVLMFQWFGQQAVAVPIGDIKPQLPSGPEVNGLKLTLSADKTETDLKADGSDAEPVKLKLTFTNVSKKPIQLDTYDLTSSHFAALTILAPDGRPLHLERTALVNRGISVPPAGYAFPTIQPGESWSTQEHQVIIPAREPRSEPLLFPATIYHRLGVRQEYVLNRPGEYRIKLTYINDAQNKPERTGSWSGTITSNELTLKVRPAPVNGLKLTLSADKTETVMKADGSNAEPVKLSLTLTNVSDKPITLDTYDFVWRHLQMRLNGPDAESVGVSRKVVEWEKRAPVAGDFPTLQPKEQWTAAGRITLPGDVAIVDPKADPGTYYQQFTFRKPGQYRVQLTYACKEVWDHPLVKDTWVGVVASNELILTVKPAGAAAKGEQPAFRVLKDWTAARTKTPTVVVLKDQKSYQAFFEESFAKNFEPKPQAEAIDFQGKQVVAVCWGDKPSTGYDVGVISLTGTAAELVITVGTSTPKGPADDAITHPAAVVEIPKCEKLKVVVIGDRTEAGRWYKDFTASTTKELEVQVK